MFIEKLTYTLKTEKYAKKTLLKEMNAKVNAHKQELNAKDQELNAKDQELNAKDQELDTNKNENLKLKQEATMNEMMIAKLT